ncbi:NitT/TauT family transport system ATP-binding protein [Arthrobacter ginsengisoli]|uniref:NitT/TauT family transport system ATP-binding protein n=1 Tax=Arthrobacter ginsengisoli TaxID=1356565 RepID=A0ABU1UHV7_9MICC|nr:ABC transporter ATP-binding protein [Arthrobacter ginsengisoli]MDR7084715.1 NitT/TauT family transport system ATP-binding protein [Arthrobacter ginsengisoli]
MDYPVTSASSTLLTFADKDVQKETSRSDGAAVSLRSVSKDFDSEAGTIRIINDVSFTVKPGEFVVLVGRSGCGKTTILNMLAGLYPPTSGAVEIFADSPQNARRRLGYMLANDALMPWRSAVRNVELGLEILGMPKKERRKKALSMLTDVGLGHAAGRLPWQLSHGMRQRVALARTWARDPGLLLMDEPFSALDAQTRTDVQATFLNVWQGSNAAVVLVTHDLSEALLLADRVIMLGDGKILREVRPPFERPRDLPSIASSDTFRDLLNELRELLN